MQYRVFRKKKLLNQKNLLLKDYVVSSIQVVCSTDGGMKKVTFYLSHSNQVCSWENNFELC